MFLFIPRIHDFGMQPLSSLGSIRTRFGFRAPYWVPLRDVFPAFKVLAGLAQNDVY